MSAVALMDTSVFVNILDVPNRNQHRPQTLDQLTDLIKGGAHLLLPMAAIIETGNHIAHIADGNLRRQCAQRFVEQVRGSFSGKAPWRPMPFPTNQDMDDWLARFPDCAMREMGIGDLSIVVEWEHACRRHPHMRVFIWSLDGHLCCHDQPARGT